MGSSTSKDNVLDTVQEIKASNTSPVDKAARIRQQAREYEEGREALFGARAMDVASRRTDAPFVIRVFEKGDPSHTGDFIAGYSTLEEAIARCDYENGVEGPQSAAATDLFGGDYSDQFTFKIIRTGRTYVWKGKGVAVWDI